MKFFCDNCQAQYMISDEKVGPAGVRVRCKKCGHVIYVRRLDAEPPPEDATVVMTPEKMAALSAGIAGLNAPAPPMEGAAPPGADAEAPLPGAPKSMNGLEEEIGQALDSMFSEGETGPSLTIPPSAGSRAPVVIGSPRTEAPIVPDLAAPVAALASVSAPVASRSPPMEDDRAETRIFTSSDMEKIAAEMSSPSPGADPAAKAVDAAALPGGSEWFIAIRDEQVGPLQIGQIKEKFESGEVAGDTLVWSSGLTDWRPLSTVEELAEHILPKRDIVRVSRPAAAAPEAAKEAPRREAVAFKPSAASALASLASMAKEEMAASERAKPAVHAAAAPAPAERAQPEGQVAAEARPMEFLAGLPSSPGPDPQAIAQPQPVPAYSNGRAAGRAAQTNADFRDSPLGRSRPRSSNPQNWKMIAGLIAGAVVTVLVLGYVGIYFAVIKPNQETSARLDRERQEAATAREAATKAQEAAAQAAALALAQVKAAAATPAPPPAPSAAPPAPPAPPPRAAEAPHERHVGKHRGREAADTNTAPVAAAAPSAEKEKAAKTENDFLGSTDVDKEFQSELDGKAGGETKSSHHGPYIPPPPGQADLPQTLSQSDVVGAVTQHRDAFAKCVQDQKRRDPSSSGTVVMRWKIKPDGRTAEVGARGDDPDSPLAGCFKAQIKSLHFGQYRGPQMAPIEFPFSY